MKLRENMNCYIEKYFIKDFSFFLEGIFVKENREKKKIVLSLFFLARNILFAKEKRGKKKKINKKKINRY
jgi:hypothetical protein